MSKALHVMNKALQICESQIMTGDRLSRSGDVPRASRFVEMDLALLHIIKPPACTKGKMADKPANPPNYTVRNPCTNVSLATKAKSD